MEDHSALVSKLGAIDLAGPHPGERSTDKAPGTPPTALRGVNGARPLGVNEAHKSSTPKRGLRAPRGGLNLQVPARGDTLGSGLYGGGEQGCGEGGNISEERAMFSGNGLEHPTETVGTLKRAPIGNLQLPATGTSAAGGSAALSQRPPVTNGRAGTSLSARKKPPGKLNITGGLGNLNGDMQQPQQKKEFSLSESGTFKEGDLTISKTGLTIQRDSGPLGAAGRPGGAFAAPERPYSLPPPPEDAEAPMVSNRPSPEEHESITLADLEVIKVVGVGSSGKVEKSRHRRTNKIFALKSVQLNMKEEVRKQIVNELKILHRSSCPSIVKCYGAFHSDGVIKIVLEYMDGGSLSDVLRAVNKIPEPFLGAISKQILLGLQYLHKLRIKHRDIKPANLLLNRRGDVKIADFGVSSQAGSSMSKCGSWVGTVTYMSPERIEGGQYGVDSDIWSMGLSIVECALGSFPYSQAPNLGFWDLLTFIVHNPAPVLPPDQFSPEFCDFVAACLKKRPQDRPSATQLLEHPFIKMYEGRHVDLAQLCK
ncbi:mitogen-activated protein kinase kinase [Klebsormidium nitens]|uniref:mitogen-activated protein kinase kinase n=1 Tax=Klebsormidium nitens TaxID=105231 RepID=A0A1Y1I5Q5_KLENI|nr:mitogen-activated protein kinase kinase [Klebsormidium nitens]|eukprot:GAQ84491.1 mitogen-activated protein kinase kinase [Klebsormidium nitens]